MCVIVFKCTHVYTQSYTLVYVCVLHFPSLRFLLLLFLIAVIVDFSVHIVGPMHCSRNPQTSLFSNFFIKNGSHGTIHNLKIILLQRFQFFSFQQNKLYPNEPYISIYIIISKTKKKSN